MNPMAMKAMGSFDSWGYPRCRLLFIAACLSSHSTVYALDSAARASFVDSLKAGECGCTSDESCCADTQGYSCCIDQTSFCVPSTGDPVYGFPARCCPQWTVGCSVGSVGCCDPAQPWQRDLDSTATPTTTTDHHQKRRDPVHLPPPSANSTVTAYALFTGGHGSGGASDLSCLTIDAATGNISNMVAVSGPAATYFAGMYGGATRVYPFSPQRRRFFALDIVQTGSSASSPITLYAIDPATGESTSTLVSGAAGNVVSFDYHPESDSVVMATGVRTDTAFSYYAVNVTTGGATPLATVARGASENGSAAYYAPYITAVDADPSRLFRLGFQVVTEQSGPGLGVTSWDVNDDDDDDDSEAKAKAKAEGKAEGKAGAAIPTATATWEDAPSVDGEEPLFYSLVRRGGGAQSSSRSSSTRSRSGTTTTTTTRFLSLAPSTASGHTLSVVSWEWRSDGAEPDAPPTVLLDAANAHPPKSLGVGNLGYVADAASADGTAYAALAVHVDDRKPMGAKDKWEIILVSGLGNDGDVSGGVVELSGNKAFAPLGAETVTVSGLGISA